MTQSEQIKKVNKEEMNVNEELDERCPADMEEIEFDSTLVQLSYELVARCEERALALGMKTSTYISTCLWGCVEKQNGEGGVDAKA